MDIAAAAAADAVHPSPQPRAWRTVAWLVRTHLAWAAADAVVCLVIASMWLLFWGQATKELGRLACSEGCAVVTTAYEVASVAAVIILVLLLPFTVVLLALMIDRAQAAASTATATDTDTEETKEPAPETLYEAMRDILCDPVSLGVLALMAFTLLMFIGVLVKGDSPVMGSRRERMGSVIYGVGALGKYALDCFFLCPFFTVQIWRCWRKARHGLRCGFEGQFGSYSMTSCHESGYAETVDAAYKTGATHFTRAGVELHCERHCTFSMPLPDT